MFIPFRDDNLIIMSIPFLHWVSIFAVSYDYSYDYDSSVPRFENLFSKLNLIIA